MEPLKILFATDFSPSAKAALILSKTLKAAYKTDTHLVYVLESFWKEWFSSGLYKKESEQRLASWQEELLEEKNADKRHIAQGNVPQTILDTSEKINANLIILGKKTPEIGSRYKSGTTPETVVRAAKQPVMILKDRPIKKILCAIDLSERSNQTLAWAVNIAKGLSAELTIMSVLPKVDFNPLGMEDEEIKKNEARLEKEGIKKAESFISNFDLSGLTIKKYFPWGTPSNVILDTAEDQGHDLIVIGALGISPLTRILLGSTAEKVLHHTPCSLLVVR